VKDKITSEDQKYIKSLFLNNKYAKRTITKVETDWHKSTQIRHS